jgi:hypothetical protein
MDDLRCPHCRSGLLINGTCIECGWSLSQAVPVLRHPTRRAPVTTGPDCWVLLPLAGALANFFLPILCRATESGYAVAFLLGTLAAQFGVLSVVGALGSSRTWVRLATTFAVAALLLLVLFMGIGIAAGEVIDPDAVRAAGGFLLMLPCAMLAAQAPLWLYRGLSGRRLEEAAWNEDHGPARRTQFGIAQMLLATALVAVILTLARGALVLWRPRGADADIEGGLVAVVLACGVLALASGAVTLPCTLAMLVAQRPSAWAGPVLVYALLLAGILLLVVAAMSPGGGVPAEAVAMFVFFCLTTFGGILAGLAIIRKSGYTLVR